MQITINATELNSALKAIAPAIAKRSHVPICQFVHIDAHLGRGTVEFTATDLEIAITATRKGTDGATELIAEGGTACIAYRSLMSAVKGVKGAVTITASEGRNGAIVQYGAARSHVDSADVSDFPPIPIVNGPGFIVDGPAFRAVLTNVLPCAATDDLRPILTAVNVQIGDDSLTLAAADGYRLAYESMPATVATPYRDAINIPQRAFAAIAKVKLAGDVTVAFNQTVATKGETHVAYTAGVPGGKVRIATDDLAIVATLNGGTFPAYMQLVPRQSDRTVTVNVGELRKAVAGAYGIAKTGANVVRFETAGSVWRISSDVVDVGSFSTDVPITLAGDDGRIAADGAFILDYLKPFADSAELRISLQGPSMPIKIEPVGCGTFTYVVMPMWVEWSKVPVAA